MTDSTGHNRGFLKLLAEMYSLETAVGQLFCGTHTTLGFSSAMNKVMRLVKADMTMEQVLKGFMLDLARQALRMCLKLVAPEFAHKPWNASRNFSSSWNKSMYAVSCLLTRIADLGTSQGQQ